MDATPARTDRWAFDRSDRVGLRIALGAVVLGAILVQVVGPVVQWVRGAPVRSALTGQVRVPALDTVGTGYGEATYEVELADPSTGQRLLDLAPGLVSLVLLLVGSWLVLRIMRSVASGDPFTATTVRRLRQLAAVLLLGPLALVVLTPVVSGVLLSQVDLGDVAPAFRLELPWLPLVGGLVVALLAEAFRAGATLREDLEGLV